MTYEEFRKQELKTNTKKNFKIKNSGTSYSAYKWIRHNKWFDLNQPITEHQFYTIIRQINDFYAEQLSNGKDIKLPNRMGLLYLVKLNTYVKFEDNKLKTNKPIDWQATLKLWYEDSESKANKVLIRKDNKLLFKLIYNKSKALYNNKGFYKFLFNRKIKINLKNNINENKIEAFTL